MQDSSDYNAAMAREVALATTSDDDKAAAVAEGLLRGAGWNGEVLSPEEERAWAETSRQRVADEELMRRVAGLQVMGFGLREIHAQDALSGDGEWGMAFVKVLTALRDGGMVFLVGECGAGKTVLACKVADKWEGSRVRYLRAADFFIGLKETWRKESDVSERVYLDRLRKAGLLILDEIQDRSAGEWENTVLTNVLDHRYANMLPTLIISNQSIEEAQKSLSRSIISRAQHVGGFVDLGKGSFRRNGGRG